jgi:predicted transcriptional regulator
VQKKGTGMEALTLIETTGELSAVTKKVIKKRNISLVEINKKTKISERRLEDFVGGAENLNVKEVTQVFNALKLEIIIK